jgi:glutaredoxin
MATKRIVEVFTAGCPVCDETVEMVRRIACDTCQVEVLNLKEEAVARRAEELDIRSVPAVVIDGTLAACCAGGVTEEALRAEGIGQPR